ncbi:inorganic triphosphatase [Aliidiomarina sanyensis]|uniref:CYTH domain-containing protein n=1 Tax=Aliidiomarina sanyensis TaxID=1249555 RepID=A0A432WBJ5_9GAMM|nr:CYTH domain-containing protein [Aliidiomarina sanyensis]RUO29454.1 hypothetical protein CWE11_09910 [Aliidiomarina sanyensis]
MRAEDSQEVELKFLINKEEISALRKFLDAHGRAIQALKLRNLYFDTPDETLSQERIGLRIRCWNDQCEQTIKLAGLQQGAMSQRPEYTVPYQGTVPDLTLFPRSIFGRHLDPISLTQSLVQMFTIEFNRERWRFYDGDAEIEVAVDQGEIISDGAREPICELELELVQGDMSLLERVVSEIEQIIVLRPGTSSKAQRGFALRHKRAAQDHNGQ